MVSQMRTRPHVPLVVGSAALTLLVASCATPDSQDEAAPSASEETTTDGRARVRGLTRD